MEAIRMCLQLRRAFLLLLGLFIFISIFYGCASRKPEFTAAFYNFQYEGENYRIRSISSDNPACSFNELISNKFVAKDYDQDGYIDEIALGEIGMAEAQKIYTYTLAKLTSQDKLREVNPKINMFQQTNSGYNCEIKSFRPTDADPFNQFKMTKENPAMHPKVIIGIDYMADGSIDEMIDGDTSMETIQKFYTEALAEGLEKEVLVKKDKMILVK